MELVVGRVVKSHGIRGEVAVQVHTDSPEERFAAGSVLRGRRAAGRGGGAAVSGRGAGSGSTEEREYTIEAARQHAGRLLVRLAGVEDKTAADALRGLVFVVDAEGLPDPADPDEFYDHQLVGLVAYTKGGARVGEVVDVLHSAGSELLVIRPGSAVDAPGQPAEVLVPFVSEIVTDVTLQDGTVTLDPPEGLLDPLDGAGS